MQRSAVFAAVLLIFGGAGLRGQSLPADLATQIAAAGHLKITTANASADLFQARLTGGNDSIAFARGEALDRRTGRRRDLPQPIPVAQLTRIELRDGNHAGTGALVGGGIGLAFGVAMIVAVSSDEWFSEGMTAGDYAALGFVPTAGGALLGTLIGALVPKWKTVFKAGPIPSH